MSVDLIAEEKQQYLNDFEALEKANRTPEWTRQLRRKAVEQFQSLNFPTIKDEDWRFTNVSPIVKSDFRSSLNPAPVMPSLRQIEPFLFGGADCPRLVFLNGHFSRKLSSIHSLPEAVKIENLSNILTQQNDLLEQHLGTYAPIDRNIFTALNTAFLHEAAVVHVPDGCVLEGPINILFISAPQGKEVYHPRVLIVTGKGSITNFVESYASLNGNPYFTNTVTEIVVGEGSVMEHYKIQRESEQGFHIAATHTHQKRDSSYSCFSLTLGAELSRNELNVLLNGIGANCILNGLYLTGGIQHVDHQTSIDHSRPHGTSHELYKGILDGKSRAVFNGKIVVRKDAQRTDAKQVNKNLLISDGARVNTKPQLEILADDVKCNHGATIGHLEDDALFYLKSRGISDQNARSLLMYGFINDVLTRLRVESVRDKLDTILMARLQQFAK